METEDELYLEKLNRAKAMKQARRVLRRAKKKEAASQSIPLMARFRGDSVWVSPEQLLV